MIYIFFCHRTKKNHEINQKKQVSLFQSKKALDIKYLFLLLLLKKTLETRFSK